MNQFSHLDIAIVDIWCPDAQAFIVSVSMLVNSGEFYSDLVHRIEVEADDVKCYKRKHSSVHARVHGISETFRNTLLNN